MFNVCYACGLYRADKIVEQSEQPGYADAICPVCGHRHRFRQLPLLIVTGASGAGKSTICQQLAGEIDYAVMLDVDILWRPEFDRPETSYRDFFETWLRMAKNIAQAGRPVVLVGAGVGVPENLAPCVERRYVGAIHYLALVCADYVLATRLHSRPAWRQSSSDEYIEAQQQFNRWFQTRSIAPVIDLLDTTAQDIAESTAQVAVWIQSTVEAARKDSGSAT